MKLALNSDAWKMISRNLREELYRIKVEGPDTRKELQEFFKGWFYVADMVATIGHHSCCSDGFEVLTGRIRDWPTLA